MNVIALLMALLLMHSHYQHQQQLLLLLCYWRLQLLHQTIFIQHRRNGRRRQRHRPYWVLPRPLQSWFEIHYYQRIIPEQFFYRQMRMKRASFDLLFATIRPFIRRENTRFRGCITPEKVLAIGLYRLAHGGGYENTGVAMNVGGTTAFEAFEDVVNSLYELRNEYIKFPLTMAETQETIATFELLSDLPNIVGAIDGTHIKIKAPKESKADYWSRYSQYDVVFQGIVNGKRLFIDIAGGFPGSMHDARVLRNTGIYEKAERGDVLATGPIHRIGPHEIKPYLVGDSAYPISTWLQKPYPEGTRDPAEIRFNYALSSARVQVECAFGILKNRWRILNCMEEANVGRVSKIVIACAVLHNFCILADDEWDDEDYDNDEDEGQNNNAGLQDGEQIREILKNSV